MTKEASGAAQQLMDEYGLKAADIEAEGDKITKPDVERHIEALAQEGGDNDSETDGDATAPETEESEGAKGGDEAAEPSESESDDEDEQEGGDSEPEPAEPEAKRPARKGKKGELICKFTVKEDGTKYHPGEKYGGKDKDHLLKLGAIYYS